MSASSSPCYQIYGHTRRRGTIRDRIYTKTTVQRICTSFTTEKIISPPTNDGVRKLISDHDIISIAGIGIFDHCQIGNRQRATRNDTIGTSRQIKVHIACDSRCIDRVGTCSVGQDCPRRILRCRKPRKIIRVDIEVIVTQHIAVKS